ncbi:MAG: signal peptidase II [Alcaligenaceae bacterium]|nr:signal peptidase II [Alcaligenaceae bacterium]
MPEGLTRSQRLRSLAQWLVFAVFVIGLDQWSKVEFTQLLDYGQRMRVLPFLDFTLLHNTGAAFSFMAGGGGSQRWLFTGLALIAAVVILRLLYTHAAQTLFCGALACILGGALGNAIDRMMHGYVVDFVLFYWNDWYFPAFNVADIAITCGAALLILDEIRQARRRRAH